MKLKKGVNFLIFIFLIFGFSGLSAQKFTASTDATKVYENGTFNITFSFDNMDEKQLSLPDFSPFKVVAGPSKSSSYSFVNGKQSSSLSYTYTLQATKKGKFTIKSATAQYNGKIIKTNSINIDVVENNVKINGLGDQIMVKLEVNKDKIYIGEQVLLDYIIYTQSDIREFNILNEPEYTGFYKMDVVKSNFSTQQVQANGKTYYTKIMKRVALFPQQAGSFEISPIVIQVGVPDPNSPRRGFFSSQRNKQLQITTNKININVEKVPDPVPADFSGAVGNVQVSNTINKNSTTTDDAIVLTQEVRCDGDAKTILPVSLDLGQEWEAYEPKVILDKTDEYNGAYHTVKRFEYLLVPRKTGVLKLIPKYTYYNPDSMRYITLSDDKFSINVKQGNRSVTTDNRDVAPINDILSVDNSSSGTIMASELPVPPLWKLLGFGLLGLALSFIGYKKYEQYKEDNLDPLLKKRRVAEEKAKNQLKQAKTLLDERNSRSFYDEISKAVTRYLSDIHQIPFSEQSKDKIVKRLGEKGVNNSDIEAYLDILKDCEMSLFAGQSGGNLQSTYDKAFRLLTEVGME